jgi:two-component system sensor histidine kinase YesM
MISTIGEQVKLLDDYINIQKIRYEERLKVNIKVDKKVSNFFMPKLILQPILENSIKYGLEVLTGVCIIDLELLKSKDILKIVITDNGPGMKEELIKKILQGKIKADGMGIGLINIKKRLNIIYEKNYSMIIKSKINNGTTIIITLPLWTLDDFSKIFYKENKNV